MESITCVAVFFVLRLGAPMALLFLISEILLRRTRKVHCEGGA